MTKAVAVELCCLGTALICFIVAIFYLVHDVEAINVLCLLLIVITVSRASLTFQKRFPDAVSS